GVDGVAAAGQRAHRGGGGQRVHPRARLLGEIEIVGGGGVLGVVRTAGQAARTVDAAVAPRTRAAEVGVVDLDTLGLVVEEDAHLGGVEGLAHAHVLGDLLDDLVGRGGAGIGHHAEHPLGLVVVGGQLAAPVGDVGPLPVGVEGGQRLVEGVAVDERA